MSRRCQSAGWRPPGARPRRIISRGVAAGNRHRHQRVPPEARLIAASPARRQASATAHRATAPPPPRPGRPDQRHKRAQIGHGQVQLAAGKIRQPGPATKARCSTPFMRFHPLGSFMSCRDGNQHRQPLRLTTTVRDQLSAIAGSRPGKDGFWGWHGSRDGALKSPEPVSRADGCVGGGGRNRTGVDGFAGRCITIFATPPKALYCSQAAPSLRKLERETRFELATSTRQGCALPTELFLRDAATMTILASPGRDGAGNEGSNSRPTLARLPLPTELFPHRQLVAC